MATRWSPTGLAAGSWRRARLPANVRLAGRTSNSFDDPVVQVEPVVKFGAVFLVVLAGTALALLIRTGSVRDPSRPGGVGENERLTALTGAPLYVLLVLIAVTILFLQPL